jgi:Ca2+-binding RTX toxin-like protein
MPRFDGTSGPDNIPGTGSDDQIFGYAGDDMLFGNDGNDRLNGGTGTDRLDGGLGDDIYYLDTVLDQVSEAAGAGRDILLASMSYVLSDSVFVEDLSTIDWTATTAINLTGNSLDNGISGNAGANILNGGAGVDVMQGFGGNDRYYVDNVHDRVIEAKDGGNDIVFTSVSYVLPRFVEVFLTTDAAATTAINLTGNDLANTVSGNAGDNIINGGRGVDVMKGFGGDDIYYVDEIHDDIVEAPGGGNDIVLTKLSYTLPEGIERISTIDVRATTPIILHGNSLDNGMSGNAGDNSLNGDAGADVMEGFGGNDFYVLDNVRDRVIEAEGGGTDIAYTTVSYVIAEGVSLETLFIGELAAGMPLNLTGNSFDNRLSGNDADNILKGGGGVDRMFGGGGNDIFYVDNPGEVNESTGNGNDIILTSVSYQLQFGTGFAEIERLSTIDWTATTAINLSGNEVDNGISGNAGANILAGSSGNDVLQAFGGDDTLVGGLGNDMLIGGLGADSLAGGTGNDLFRFESALGGGNVDTITDFAPADDAFLLDDAVFGGLPLGVLAAGAFHNGTAAADADDRILYDSTTGALLFDADGVDGGAAVQFAILQGAPVLTAADFVVI